MNPMKLHLSQQGGQNLFTAYGDGYVTVNQVRYESSLIVLPETVLTDWPPHTVAELEAGHFTQLLALRPEVVLLGTGASFRFPHPRVSLALVQAGIGFEVMDSFAAARTYNILMGEGRQVAAALLL